MMWALGNILMIAGLLALVALLTVWSPADIFWAAVFLLLFSLLTIAAGVEIALGWLIGRF